VRIPADTIDHVLAGMAPVKVDFIKMDVEGSEKESLSGARETIRKDHPVLAVSVYHKIEDLYEIPRMIEDIVGGLEGGYAYYLRYHGANLYDVVLYAVPKK